MHDAEDFSGSLSYDDLISHWARFCYRIVVLAIRSGVARAASRPSDRSNSLRDVQTSTDNSAIIPRLISAVDGWDLQVCCSQSQSSHRTQQPSRTNRNMVIQLTSNNEILDLILGHTNVTWRNAFVLYVLRARLRNARGLVRQQGLRDAR